jgi:hypothetical protein
MSKLHAVKWSGCHSFDGEVPYVLNAPKCSADQGFKMAVANVTADLPASRPIYSRFPVPQSKELPRNADIKLDAEKAAMVLCECHRRFS